MTSTQEWYPLLSCSASSTAELTAPFWYWEQQWDEIYLRYCRLHLECFRVSHNSSSIFSLWTLPSKVKWVKVFLPMNARQKSWYASGGETFLILGNIKRRDWILGATDGWWYEHLIRWDVTNQDGKWKDSLICRLEGQVNGMIAGRSKRLWIEEVYGEGREDGMR